MSWKHRIGLMVVRMGWSLIRRELVRRSLLDPTVADAVHWLQRDLAIIVRALESKNEDR